MMITSRVRAGAEVYSREEDGEYEKDEKYKKMVDDSTKEQKR